MSKPFRFKQFSIHDENSSMKVGTDAVLIGAWTEVAGKKNILEVGSGSGVISLMLAQRSKAEIDALEIHQPSCDEAAGNFYDSPWSGRLRILNFSFSNYTKTCSKKYDLIVSNPPFFKNSLKSPNENINLAHHTISLSHEELVKGITQLLDQDGSLSVILPYSEFQHFIDLAKAEGLQCNRICKVFPKEGKPAHRVMLNFIWIKPEIISESVLSIRNADDSFHKDYRELTKDFYLEF